MIRLDLADPADAAHIVVALLDRADQLDSPRPTLAVRYRVIADALGDALDTLPRPSDA